MPGSLDLLFQPRQIAVIGASDKPHNLGRRIVGNLLDGGFVGSVFAVHPHAERIGDLRVYSSVKSLPERVSLAVICLPREAVLDAVDQCVQTGVKALIVISAGFAETDAEGDRLQELLAAKAREHGVRIVGPNCVGVINTDPSVRLNSTFCPGRPAPGRVALASQSGALGVLAAVSAARFAIGLSKFISVGNEADVSAAELIQYWGDDSQTDIILLYLESISRAAQFREAAVQVGRSKPIVVVKSGCGEAGERAARSHTAALASSEAAIDALFRQTGMIRAAGLDELLDLGALLRHQPRMAGRRVGIITNAGGPAVLCADAAARAGLEAPVFSRRLQQQLRTFIAPPGVVANPVNMLASAGPAEYRQAIEALLGCEELDAVIVVYVPIEMTPNEEFLRAICDGVAAVRARTTTRQPVLACVLSQSGERVRLTTRSETIPCCIDPAQAAVLLGKAADYARWRREPLGIIPPMSDMDFAAAREAVATARRQSREWLSTAEVRDWADALRLPLASGLVVHSPGEASQAARQIGFPIALKAASARILHKTEADVVELGVHSDVELHDAFQRISRRLASASGEAAADGMLVQPMYNGVEFMIGATRDPQLGPLVAFGLGGTRVEILGDICFRLAPLTDRDVQEMVKSIRGYPLLCGYRGQPPLDIRAIEEVLLRVSRLMVELSEVMELDLNPVMALPAGDGAKIVDARIRVSS